MVIHLAFFVFLGKVKYMKKILKISVLLLALSFGLMLCTPANAQEEPKAQAEEHDHNYFKHLYTLNGSYDQAFITDGEDYTNIVPVLYESSAEKYDLFIAVDYSTLNISCDVNFVLLDGNMRVFDEITVDGDNSTTNGTFKMKIDMSGVYEFNAKYIMIQVLCNTSSGEISMNDMNGMCIKYVPAEYVLEAITPNYNQCECVAWNDETSPYLQKAKVSATVSIYDLIADLKAVETSSQNKLKYSVYSVTSETVKQVGKTYTYVLKVTTSDGFDDYLLINLIVDDTQAPVIYGVKNFSASAANPMSVMAIKNSLIAIDDYDGEVEIYVKRDYYTPNSTTPGLYVVEFYAEDEAGNYTQYDVYVEVKDIDGPKFSNDYGQEVNRMSVYKSTDSVFVYKEAIDLIKAVDDIDGICEITIFKDSYTGRGDRPGSYTITFESKDLSGNSSYFVVDIVVSSDMPSKTLILDDRIIIVENTQKLTRTSVAKMMKVCGFYTDATTSYIDVYLNNYADYSNVIGDYIVSYEIKSTNGQYKDGSFNVEVVESRIASGSIYNEKVEEETDGFIVKIFKWIWNLLKSIFNWFIGIFK